MKAKTLADNVKLMEKCLRDMLQNVNAQLPDSGQHYRLIDVTSDARPGTPVEIVRQYRAKTADGVITTALIGVVLTDGGLITLTHATAIEPGHTANMHAAGQELAHFMCLAALDLFIERVQ